MRPAPVSAWWVGNGKVENAFNRARRPYTKRLADSAPERKETELPDLLKPPPDSALPGNAEAARTIKQGQEAQMPCRFISE